MDIIFFLEFVFSTKSSNLYLFKYRKIPDKSPGLILFQRHFLGDLYPGELITGGFCVREKE